MRGADDPMSDLFSCLSPGARVRADHPLCDSRATNAAFAELSPRFEALYARIGRPSIPPEQLLWAMLLQTLYTVRTARALPTAVSRRSSALAPGRSSFLKGTFSTPC